MRGERVPVGNEEHTLILVLHSHETLHCSEIIAQVQVACGADAAYYFFHCLLILSIFILVAKIVQIECKSKIIYNFAR